MPVGAKMSAADISTINDWILAGAKSPVAGSTPAPPLAIPLAGNFKSIYANIITPKCIACHSSTLAKDGIRLDSYSAVLRYVNLATPNQSKLYKITASGEMPQKPYTRLNSTELGVLEDWINARALNN